MAHVVAEPCINCRYSECVAVCPVDCFHEGANFLAIDPDNCIDCGACVPACPTQAIFREEELPAKWADYKEKNARVVKVWPRTTRAKNALPDADKWAGVADKAALFDETPGQGD